MSVFIAQEALTRGAAIILLAVLYREISACSG